MTTGFRSRYFALLLALTLAQGPGCGLPERDIPPPKREIRNTGIYDLSDIPGSGGDLICMPVPVANSPSCRDGDIDAFIDCHYDSLFSRSGNGWTGGDATYSIKLPDGRTAWLFGDTFLGTVNPDGTRPGGIPLINNSVVITRGRSFSTFHGGTAANPEAYITPPEGNGWYWPNDPTLHDGKLQLLLSHMGRSGSGGMWDFQLRSIDLAIISIEDFSIDSVFVRIDSDEIYWGAAVMEDAGYTYIYGVEDVNPDKYLHIARVAGGNLLDAWEFFDGDGWKAEPTGYRVRNGVSNQFSVFANEGRYYLLTQELIFGSRIYLYSADEPTGPWSNRKVVYCTPETGGNIFTYNAFAHPGQSIGEDLFVTYNVNSFVFGDLFEDVTNYRPRFIRIQNWK